MLSILPSVRSMTALQFFILLFYTVFKTFTVRVLKLCWDVSEFKEFAHLWRRSPALSAAAAAAVALKVRRTSAAVVSRRCDRRTDRRSLLIGERNKVTVNSLVRERITSWWTLASLRLKLRRHGYRRQLDYRATNFIGYSVALWYLLVSSSVAVSGNISQLFSIRTLLIRLFQFRAFIIVLVTLFV